MDKDLAVAASCVAIFKIFKHGVCCDVSLAHSEGELRWRDPQTLGNVLEQALPRRKPLELCDGEGRRQRWRSGGQQTATLST